MYGLKRTPGLKERQFLERQDETRIRRKNRIIRTCSGSSLRSSPVVDQQRTGHRETSRASHTGWASGGTEVDTTSSQVAMAAVNISSNRKASFTSTSSISRAVRSGDNVEDRRERLVRNRLRWLEGHWDKSPPPTTGTEILPVL